MKTTFAVLSLCLVYASVTQGALIVADDFNRTDSSTLGTTSSGGYTWNETEAGSVTTGLRISGNAVVAGSTTAGREYGYVNLSSAPGYNTTLTDNANVLTWAINMRQTRSDPSGFDSANYGVGFILASSVSTDISMGSGYAVVLGNNSANDPIRLTRFTGGFNVNSDFTDIISGNDYGSE